MSQYTRVSREGNTAASLLRETDDGSFHDLSDVLFDTTELEFDSDSTETAYHNTGGFANNNGMLYANLASNVEPTVASNTDLVGLSTESPRIDSETPSESPSFLSPLQYEVQHHNGIQAPDEHTPQEGSSTDMGDDTAQPWHRRFLHRSHTLINRYFPYSPLSQVAAGDRGGAYVNVVRGAEFDGVFGTAASTATPPKPAAAAHVLPTYATAISDPAPSYASTFDPYAEDSLFIDGLPVGNVVILGWNLIIVLMFQYVGFIMTYLLHTSHASKCGAQFGLGLTLLNWGVQMWRKPANGAAMLPHDPPIKLQPNDPSNFDVVGGISGSVDTYHSDLPTVATAAAKSSDAGFTSHMPFVWLVLAAGVAICLKAMYDYYQVKQLEWKIFNGFSFETLEEGVYGRHPEEEAFDLEELRNRREEV
ncbi:hypothetical protein BABINDRAFT_162288 [Babjeviella inositovora NRRL Y-12698]|uniref:Metal homeostatis protein bsd2 n=1 Tax=Babjeviella inositovora NRRL Y-12698 TaxID=984486 RepID=A0A1E3QNI8_9ASCO|nr:uncharacterized protein BABINDRAFT_162288 [Babjeviella inositovora NRRL Y-12698]ODQ79253.1 hypothetical protein BABINDRAFT_162288 [Babjeviella inositovora NRRL Y-12698]